MLSTRVSRQRKFLRKPGAVLAGIALAGGATLAAGLGYLTWEIHQHSQRSESAPADAIVIMGAAEYRGHPSPVLRARLDHGLSLFEQGLARYIVTTGGAGGDPDFTEAEVGRAYLIGHGVPSEVILLESAGDSTVHSAAAVAEIMQQKKLRSCLLVSDGYHIFRARRILEKQGLRVYGSPRPEGSPKEPWQAWWLCLRQAVGYTLWSVGIPV